MEVEDVLPGGLAGGVPDVHAVGVERRLQQRGHAMHHPGDTSVRGLGDRPDAGRVLARYDQGVPA
nr:hypothetical protein [Nonomuraea phyllanthi]